MEAHLSLLKKMITEPCYSQLRTKEQLGYVRVLSCPFSFFFFFAAKCHFAHIK